MESEFFIFDDDFFFALKNTTPELFKAEEWMMRINKKILSIPETKEAARCVRHYQISLLKLKEIGEDKEAYDLLLHHLETFFPQLSEPSYPVSKLSRNKLHNVYHNEILDILNEEVFDAELSVALYPLFLLKGHEMRTFAKFLYQREVIPVFVKFMMSKIKDKDQIISFFIQYNFNYEAFVEYLKTEVLSETNDEDYIEEQMEILVGWQKFFNQQTTREGMKYEANLPSVKEQMLVWLKEEIHFAKRKLKSTPENQQRFEFKTNTKIQTALSVKQLSCLFRAFNETGIIRNTVQKDVFKVVAKSFETEIGKEISLNNLYNTQFDIDEPTKEAVRKMLLETQRKLNTF